MLESRSVTDLGGLVIWDYLHNQLSSLNANSINVQNLKFGVISALKKF